MKLVASLALFLCILADVQNLFYLLQSYLHTSWTPHVASTNHGGRNSLGESWDCQSADNRFIRSSCRATRSFGRRRWFVRRQDPVSLSWQTTAIWFGVCCQVQEFVGLKFTCRGLSYLDPQLLTVRRTWQQIPWRPEPCTALQRAVQDSEEFTCWSCCLASTQRAWNPVASWTSWCSNWIAIAQLLNRVLTQDCHQDLPLELPGALPGASNRRPSVGSQSLTNQRRLQWKRRKKPRIMRIDSSTKWRCKWCTENINDILA